VSHFSVLMCVSLWAWEASVLFVSFRGITKSAIEKLVQQSKQFQLAIDLYWAAQESLPLQKFP